MAVARRPVSTDRSANRRAAGTLAPLGEGLEREQLVDFQRARMVSAMLEAVLETGAGSMTVADVVARSGVSRRTFYEVFADREECFLAALDDSIERIAAVVVPAYEDQGRWRERVRAALGELLGLLEADPSLGRIAIVESLLAGPRALQRRGAVLASVVAAVEEGRLEPGASEPPPLTAEGVVGGVASILYTRLHERGPASAGGRERKPGGRAGALTELTSPLMAMIVLPYLGKAAAARELERPAPEPRAPHPGGNPLRDLGMRLTYRTLRVLEAVAANPGASNRRLGEAAGIADQGQISKLLWRLQRLSLIENVLVASGKGAPNAWRLTEKGERIVQSIRANTEGSHSNGASRRSAIGGEIDA
jgi:AcrR family transcriptional regulator